PPLARRSLLAAPSSLPASPPPTPAASHSCSACLFSSCGAHRALPSFPTRRSSDLRLKGWRARWWSPRAHPESRSTGFVPAEHARSEEHTSELQSRFDLVCRLLLEKKKRKMIRTQPTHSRSQPRREISLSFL